MTVSRGMLFRWLLRLIVRIWIFVVVVVKFDIFLFIGSVSVDSCILLIECADIYLCDKNGRLSIILLRLKALNWMSEYLKGSAFIRTYHLATKTERSRL